LPNGGLDETPKETFRSSACWAFGISQVQALALAPAGLVQCLFGTGPAQAQDMARYGKMKRYEKSQRHRRKFVYCLVAFRLLWIIYDYLQTT